MKIEDQAVASASRGCPYSGLGSQYRAFEHEGVHEFLARARQEEPVFYSPEIDYWVVTRREDVMAVMRHPDRFSASTTLEPVTPFPEELSRFLRENDFTIEPVQSNTDRPKHTRIRMAAGQFLNAKRYASYYPQIKEMIERDVAALKGREQIDLIADLAYELPARIVFLLLGIHDVDPRQIKRWGFNRAALTWGRTPPEHMMDAGRDLNEFFQFSRALVRQRKEQPGDDYPSKLLEIRGGNDEVLTENEIICLVFGIMLAGHEAVTAAMGNIFHALLEQPGNWARLVDNPALIPSAVEEGLRFNSGMFNWRRRATEDVVLGGVTVPKDAKILVSLGSANRDDRHFADPHTFDPTRANVREHLAFGSGIHVCIGAPLARFQMVTLLEALVREFPRMTLIPNQTPNWIRTICPRGLTTLLAYPNGVAHA